MKNYKKEYEKIFQTLSNDDQLAFQSLNKEFDKNFVTEDAKFEKLYIMAAAMTDSGKDYVEYYNAKTKDVARVASKICLNTGIITGQMLPFWVCILPYCSRQQYFSLGKLLFRLYCPL